MIRILSLLFPVLVFSCKTTELEKSTSNYTAVESSLLWEIQAEKSPASSWIFGTIHLIDQQRFVLRDEVMDKMALAEKVVFELKLNDLSIYSRMNELLTLPENQTIESLVSQPEYSTLRTWVEDSMGMSMAQFNNKKPFALTQLISQQLIDGVPASYELHLLAKAVASGQSIEGLETLEDQIGLFDQISVQEQVQWLLESIENMDSMRAGFNEMVDIYLQEDVESLINLMKKSSPEFDEYEDLLLSERNKVWVEKMAGMMREGPVFFAVGAGHLAGPNGIVNLLRNSGYSVTPVFPVE